VTTHRELHVREVRPNWFAVDGFPADCVRVALSLGLKSIDWVLAGINEGGNLGADLLLSGTASAAREAAIRGHKGIAISQYKARRGDVNWSRAQAWTSSVLPQLFEREPPLGGFWNVNLPDPLEPVEAPPLIECPVDSLPLPVLAEFQGGKWRYITRYQERPRTDGCDVALCFGGAITLSAVFCRW
jgi:5'-nucleotidase